MRKLKSFSNLRFLINIHSISVIQNETVQFLLCCTSIMPVLHFSKMNYNVGLQTKILQSLSIKTRPFFSISFIPSFFYKLLIKLFRYYVLPDFRFCFFTWHIHISFSISNCEITFYSIRNSQFNFLKWNISLLLEICCLIKAVFIFRTTK